MKDYLLLFRGGEMQGLSEEERNKHLAKWGQWIGSLSKEGKFAGGDPLGVEARVISGKKMAVTDGPYAESKEMVGGYLIIKAADLNSATEITKECPIYEVDDVTEIREIHHMDF
ncbi:MAG: YciI family protein [Chlorobi bacterium]|nr:YciI family protein [Chlorobiota bacterium]MCI0716474.1 YciI family protein [Chlorobiota bacterium]